MMSSLGRSSPPLYSGDSQLVQTWLTNVQTWLLSDADTDHVAAIREHTHALLQRHRDTDEAPCEDKPLLELQVGAQLDRGIRRKQRPNEDCLFVAQAVVHSFSAPPKPLALCVVADGMGGHANGQAASQLAVQSLVEHVFASLFSEQMTPDAFLSLLIKGVQSANQAVYQRNQELFTNMGTTMTVTLVHDSTVYIAHVGDSRAYLYHEPAGLHQLTRDHSIVASLVEAGVIQPDDIYTHPARNQIYRCLGEKPVVEAYTSVVSLDAGDTLLLCSDGLWEMVRDPQIAAILTSSTPDPSQTANALVQAALAGGGSDNVSVIVVQLNKRCKGK